jgi:hypothetical protein
VQVKANFKFYLTVEIKNWCHMAPNQSHQVFISGVCVYGIEFDIQIVFRYT